MTPLRKLQLTELEILKEFVRICNEENYTYYISGGTYLGAVRHKGFIPWDDDVDVAMPREDYEKFLKIVSEKLDAKYEFQCYKLTSNYYQYFSKIINNKINVKNNSRKESKIEPAWIDIFPLDGVPNNKLILFIHECVLLFKRALVKYASFSNVDLKRERPLIEKILIFVGTHINVGKHLKLEKRLDSLDRSLKKYPAKESKYYMNFMGAYKFKSIISKEVYGNGALYDFEGLKLNAPSDYDKYLTQIYGDYMKLPKEGDRNKHNTEVIDSE